MQQPEQAQLGWSPIRDAKVSANVLMLVAQGIASPMEVILRGGFGRQYFGIPAAIGVFVIPAWTVFFPRDDPKPLIGFWLFYLACQFYARVTGCLPSRRAGHSRYNGRPRLSILLPRVPEHAIKSIVEPALTIGAGLALLEVSPPLASYLITAGVCLSMAAGTLHALHRARATQLHDQWIEQRQLADTFRRLQRGERV